MKKKSDIGSRIATVHNGSALFTGDAGQGASNIRQMIIEKDLLEAIIAMPKNIFYKTGLPTYVWILSKKKKKHRKGKTQLINAVDIYSKLRKNLGQKNCELSKEQIKSIIQLYLDFKETDISKIFNNDDFGYWKIRVERPLRLSANITPEAIESLRFHKSMADIMKSVYSEFGDSLYNDPKEHKADIEEWLKKNEIKLTGANKKKLFDSGFWKTQKKLMETGKKLFDIMGNKEYDDFNVFRRQVASALESLRIKMSASEKKAISDAASRKNENAKPVQKKIEKDGTIIYEPDPELRDTEQIPLNRNIESYFAQEVLQYVPDAWIDHSKTVKGYEISFTRYFYRYKPPRSLEAIGADIAKLQKETDGLLEEFVLPDNNINSARTKKRN